jgi:hypothetical protein
MKPGIPASERSRNAAAIRKPGPVRRLSREEIAALEHKRRLAAYFAKAPK